MIVPVRGYVMTTTARLAALLLLAGVSAGCSQVGPSSGDAGKAAPPIAGQDGEGRFMRLSEFQGKVVLLDFWYSACGPCRAFEPEEKALLKAYEGRPFVILGINADPSREKLVKTQQDAELPWRSWYDGPNGPIASRLGVRAFPTVYLIDHLGRIRFHSEGMPPYRVTALEKKLEELVQEAEQQGAAGGN
jgi:thiol-disulfide isomerase/thioredoxin